MSGYSSTPLAKKLGIKPGQSLRLINAPSHYKSLFTDLPEDVSFSDSKKTRKDLIHFFVTSVNELYKTLPDLKNEIQQDGMIWVSWPKRSSGMKTDVTEDLIRECAIQHGLVDVKVCAVDETWSGLKLVIPLKNRTSQ